MVNFHLKRSEWFIAAVTAGPHEVRLIRDLMREYEPDERPARVDNTALRVEFMVDLKNIIDVVRCDVDVFINMLKQLTL